MFRIGGNARFPMGTVAVGSADSHVGSNR